MITAQSVQKQFVFRAEFIWRLKLCMNKLMLPVRIKEAAVRIIAEWLSGHMVKQRLHNISLYYHGEPWIIIDQKFTLELLFKRNGRNSQLLGQIILP